jgi:hypothetical protein
MPDLELLTRRLLEHRVECVLIGGFAALAYGVTLVTRDVDICCRFDFENLQRLQTAVAGLHPTLRTPQRPPLEITPEFCARLDNLFLSTDAGALDCLGRVAGLGDFREVQQWSTVITLWGHPCHILTLDGLIRAKEAVMRTVLIQLRAIRERSQGAASGSSNPKQGE